jgi:undecaprenyl-phosphate 4-deoxy-4-formamido-L-arabinose transferase
MPRPVPKLSVVIPVYNEEQVLPTLFARLYPALDALGISYECVFVNDGSRDRSVALLRQQFQRRPAHTRVVLFHANFGQHSAVMAGLAYARGGYVVTLDADLQNPPEEIGKLVRKLDEGYDYVGTIRQQRQDFLWRRLLSKGMNKIRERITPVRITDQGCMMRGYARSVVAALNQTREVNTFIPALASLYAMNPIEVPIAHEERYAGQSKYSLYSLIRLNFDLITGFSVVPLQLFSMVGMAVSGLSALLVIYLFVRRIIFGPEVEGVFTLFGVVFFFIGLALFGIGLLGEYVGRIYAQVRERPRYLVEAVLEEPGLEGPGLEGPGLEGPGLEGPGLGEPGLGGPGLAGPGLEGRGLEGRGLERPGEDPAAGRYATALRPDRVTPP